MNLVVFEREYNFEEWMLNVPLLEDVPFSLVPLAAHWLKSGTPKVAGTGHISHVTRVAPIYTEAESHLTRQNRSTNSTSGMRFRSMMEPLQCFQPSL